MGLVECSGMGYHFWQGILELDMRTHRSCGIRDMGWEWSHGLEIFQHVCVWPGGRTDDEGRRR